MLWGAALYNNGSFPLKQARFGESYSMNGAPQRLQTVPPPTEWEISDEGRRAVPRPAARASRPSQPGNILRIFERGRREPPGGRPPEPVRGSGQAPRRPQRPRPRHREPHRPRLRQPARRPGSSTRRSTSSAPTTTPATIAPAAAPPATSSTPTTARRSTPAPTPTFGNHGTSFQNPDPTIPQERAGPSDRAQVHRGHPDQPVHRLPRPPRHQRA